MEIKQLRKQAGMSQCQLATFLEIPLSTLRKWEQGERECKEYILKLIIYKLRNENKI